MQRGVLREGLMAFHCRISPSQIEKEKFTFVQICFKVLQVRESLLQQTVTSTIEICSECAQSGHTHHNCTSITKRCLNCPEGSEQLHRTLAPSCPAKKQVNQTKRTSNYKKKMRSKNTKTYSSIVKATIKETSTHKQDQSSTITDKTQLQTSSTNSRSPRHRSDRRQAI